MGRGRCMNWVQGVKLCGDDVMQTSSSKRRCPACARAHTLCSIWQVSLLTPSTWHSLLLVPPPLLPLPSLPMPKLCTFISLLQAPARCCMYTQASPLTTSTCTCCCCPSHRPCHALQPCSKRGSQREDLSWSLSFMCRCPAVCACIVEASPLAPSWVLQYLASSAARPAAPAKPTCTNIMHIIFLQQVPVPCCLRMRTPCALHLALTAACPTAPAKPGDSKAISKDRLCLSSSCKHRCPAVCACTHRQLP